MENINEIKKDIIKELFSNEMSEHLCKTLDSLSDITMSDIIGYSLLDIHKKYEYAKELNLKKLEDGCKNAIDKLERKDGEIFYLQELSRNTYLEYLLDRTKKHQHNDRDIIRAIDVIDHEVGFGDEENNYGIMPFLDVKNVIKYIETDKIDEKDGIDFEYDKYYFYRLDKYRSRDLNPDLKNNDRMYCRYASDMYLDCEYYVVNGKIVYFKEYDYKRMKKDKFCIPDFDRFSHFNMLGDLNLSIPFKVGDIVTCNRKPFANDKNMIILEVGDFCCSVQVAFFDEYGKLSVGALKRNHLDKRFKMPCVSPLYTLRSIEIENLEPNEKFEFERIKKEINGDEEKGREIWNEISKYS